MNSTQITSQKKSPQMSIDFSTSNYCICRFLKRNLTNVMRNLNTLQLAAIIGLIVLFIQPMNAQSDGSSTVSSIESKGKQVEQLRNQISDLERERSDSYLKESDKLAELKRQLSMAKLRKSEALNELRSGLYCDQCSRTKTEIETQENISFYSHLTQVNGTAVAASPELIAKKEAQFDAEIKKIEDEIIAFQNEANEFVKLRLQINDKIDKANYDIERICKEMQELAAKYAEQVTEQGKRIALFHLDDVVSALAAKHVAEDDIFSLEKKIQNTEAEFLQKKAEVIANLRKSDDEKKDNLYEENRRLNQLEYDQLSYYRSDRLNLETRLNQIINAIDDLNKELLKSNLSADDRSTKEMQLNILQSDQTDTQSAINALDYKRDAEKTNNENQIRKNSNDSFEIDATRTKRETALVNDLREAYDDKIEILNDAINSRKMAIIGHQGSYTLAVAEGDNALKEIDKYIGNEQMRISTACSNSQCGCFPIGPSHYLRWNRGMECAGTLDFHGECFYDAETEAMYQQALGFHSSGSMSNGDRHANRGQAKLSRAIQSIYDNERK